VTVRIAHVVSSLQVGGAETIAIRLAIAQREQGHHVSIVALTGGPLEAACAAAQLPVHILPGRSGARRAAGAALHFARRRCDVVNTHNPSAHRVGLAARLMGFPVLALTMHGEVSRSYQRLLGSPLADGVIACSSRVAETFFAWHPGFDRRRLVVVENGVALPERSVAGDALATVRRPGHRVVVCVARLDPLKDLGNLIRAVAAQKHPTQLVVVGDGEEREKLEALAHHTGARDRVAFLGFRSDVAALLAAADLFALSSRTEGLSIAVLEAMAAGLPVVATAVGGTPDLVVPERTGLLVPPGDPVALGAAISRLLDDRARCTAFGAAGRERVLARFSLNAMARNYLEVYRELEARRPRLARQLVGRMRQARAKLEPRP
jgi:glycosyltransferase involved in cell wall biosynthesis